MSTRANPTPNSKNKRSKRLFFTGFTMGVADLVPGVSGGTIAFLFGIYDELLYSIRVVTGQVPRLLFNRKFKKAWQAVPFKFLVPLAAGLLLALVLLVQIVTYLLENQAVYIWSLFFGLVIGSVLIISKRVPSWTWQRAVLLILGFTFIFVLLGLPVLNTQATPLVLFATGAIAIMAMILPGISGSLIMVILGQYETVVHALSGKHFSKLVYFALGAIFGLALFSRLLSWLLRHYHAAVVAFLIGVMAGSLRRVWPWQTENSDGTFTNFVPELGWPVLAALLLMVVGFLLVIRLEKAGIAKEHIDITDKEFKAELKSQHD